MKAMVPLKETLNLMSYAKLGMTHYILITMKKSFEVKSQGHL